MNAIALNSAQFQSSRLLGPLVTGGFVLVGASLGNVFLLNAASFLFVIAALWAIHPMPHASAAGSWPTCGRVARERVGPADRRRELRALRIAPSVR